jgi:predicted nucleic acid-binding protein
VACAPLEPPIVTLDTSALFALLNRRDPDHEAVTRALLADRGPYLVPAAILAEIGYLIEQRLGLDVLDAFLADLEQRAFVLEAPDDDLPRVRELVRRYADLPLGLADAAVIACAERRGGIVLTLDQRHFNPVARERTITLLET